MSLWTPANITSATLAAWYQASDTATITLNGSTVAQWDDKSLNGRHLAQANASLQPAYTDNAVIGNGSSATMVASMSGVSDGTQNAYTIFAVVTPNENQASIPGQTTTGAGFYDSRALFNIPLSVSGNTTTTTGPVAPVLSISGNAIALTETRSALAPYNISRSASIGVGAKGCVYVKRTTAAALSSSVNFGAPVSATTGAVTNLSWTGLVVPANYGDNANYFNGAIHEIIVIFGNLSADEIDQMEGYIAWANGLVALLPTDHPYKAAAPEASMLAVSAALDGQYEDASSLYASLVGIYGLVMETALMGRYGDASQLSTALVGRYSDASLLQAGLVGRYADTLSVLAALDGRYDLAYSVLAGLEGRYSVSGSEVLAALDGRYDLRERNEIQAALMGYYSLMPSPTVQIFEDPPDPDPDPDPAPGIPISAPSWTPVLIGGVVVKWSAVQWTISEDSYLIEATITLHDAAEFASIARMDTVTITWQGTTYTLFVAAKLRSRSVSGSPGAASYGVDYTIVARSLTAALDEPYALPATIDWPAATMASAIAAQLIAQLSDIITLDWRLEDWLQPGGTFFLTDETPLAGLRKLAGIVGGVLQTSPGNALIIRRADPVPPKDWATASPAWIIDDSGLFSDSESEDISSLYNVITVTNQSTGDNSIRFETEEIDKYRHKVKGFRVPWLDFNLGTSGGAWVTIEDGGVVEESITETVEFIDGSATATNPVHSAVSANWLRSQLGAITASEDGSLTSETQGTTLGCSLAEITYTTKYHSWIGRSDRDEEVQFYAVEIP